jgi:hypothetical protein
MKLYTPLFKPQTHFLSRVMMELSHEKDGMAYACGSSGGKTSPLADCDQTDFSIEDHRFAGTCCSTHHRDETESCAAFMQGRAPGGGDPIGAGIA